VFPASLASGWGTSSVPNGLLANSSVIEIADLADNNFTISGSASADRLSIRVNSLPGDELRPNDYVILVNCGIEPGKVTAEYAQIANIVNTVSPAVITFTKALINEHGETSRLIMPTARQYYVTGSTQTPGVFNLNMRQFQRTTGWAGSPARPLIYSVTKFEVRVGKDSNMADAVWQTDVYEPATGTAVTNVQNLPDILSLQITYALATAETSITTGDSSGAKRFSRPDQIVTINLRNRTD
jgi:hypothetical protein